MVTADGATCTTGLRLISGTTSTRYGVRMWNLTYPGAVCGQPYGRITTTITSRCKRLCSCKGHFQTYLNLWVSTSPVPSHPAPRGRGKSLPGCSSSSGLTRVCTFKGILWTACPGACASLAARLLASPMDPLLLGKLRSMVATSMTAFQASVFFLAGILCA